MFTIEVKDTGVKDALSALSAKVGNMQPILQSIGEDIMERTKARFATSTGPDGARWKPNARSTIEAFIGSKGGFGKKGINKKGQGLGMSKKPLIGHSGDLRRQFHISATANSVTVGNSMIYAAIHQFGGKAGRGKKVAIPARPFLPIRENGYLYADEQASILDAINAYLAGK
ncbi:phage virion morphogenesis protein [Propionivibrio sp.]|uniref:phage virion morphogenesis protein n=1 Tax=Propionivibrio sp. TaxID=2212460 RepID=UPI003BF45310